MHGSMFIKSLSRDMIGLTRERQQLATIKVVGIQVDGATQRRRWRIGVVGDGVRIFYGYFHLVNSFYLIDDLE